MFNPAMPGSSRQMPLQKAVDPELSGFCNRQSCFEAKIPRCQDIQLERALWIKKSCVTRIFLQ
jgi:hypothetical protein